MNNCCSLAYFAWIDFSISSTNDSSNSFFVISSFEIPAVLSHNILP